MINRKIKSFYQSLEVSYLLNVPEYEFELKLSMHLFYIDLQKSLLNYFHMAGSLIQELFSYTFMVNFKQVYGPWDNVDNSCAIYRNFT